MQQNLTSSSKSGFTFDRRIPFAASAALLRLRRRVSRSSAQTPQMIPIQDPVDVTARRKRKEKDHGAKCGRKLRRRGDG